MPLDCSSERSRADAAAWPVELGPAPADPGGAIGVFAVRAVAAGEVVLPFPGTLTDRVLYKRRNPFEIDAGVQTRAHLDSGDPHHHSGRFLQ